MPKKTNAARILDRLHIHYELVSYPVDEEHLDAVHVAAATGMPPDRVFKTLCLRGDRIPVLLAVIPADREVDLKALARVSGNKRCELVALKELLPLTGYIRGGCSPLGTRKSYPVFADEHCLGLELMAISAGQRGLQLLLRPEDFIGASGAVTGQLTTGNLPK